jgi:hypothetical protein
VGCYLSAKYLGADLIGDEEHDDISSSHSRLDGKHAEAILLGKLCGRVLSIADDNFQTTVAQVEGLGTALIAIAYDRYPLAVEVV